SKSKASSYGPDPENRSRFRKPTSTPDPKPESRYSIPYRNSDFQTHLRSAEAQACTTLGNPHKIPQILPRTAPSPGSDSPQSDHTLLPRKSAQTLRFPSPRRASSDTGSAPH